MKKINLLVRTASILLMLFVYSGYSQCTNSTTWDGSAWSNGAPISTTNAIIDANYDTANDGSIDCCSIVINTGNTLTIASGDYANVYGNIDVITGGTLLVKSGASLIPVSDTCISNGIVTVERRTPSTKRFDYTYWSSPVTTTIGNALIPTKWEPGYTFTFNTALFYDVESTYMGTFISANPDGQDDDGNSWTHTGTNDQMIPGKGYASMIKSAPAVGIYPRSETVSFSGELNTGNISIPISLSQNTAELNDDFNLVGNPYSSAINSDDVIDSNIGSITGTLYFWTHTNTMSAVYPGLAQNNFSPNDYAKYTKLGGITAVFGGKKPTNVIGSCQGFLIEADELGTQLSFMPSMMSKAYVNTTAVAFFRGNNNYNGSNREGKLWLNMSNGSDLFSQQLVGYNNSTNKNYNKGWDSKITTPRQILKFYSVGKNVNYDIQTRGEFDRDDKVKLGYFSAIDGEYTISIDVKEGIMTNKNVYLYDKSFDIWHDLSEPYTFSTIAGTFENRFFIKYKNPYRDNETHDDDEENDEENDKSSFNTKIEVYDMFNRHIQTIQGYNYEELPSGQILILKIYKDDGVETKKYFRQ